MYTPNRKGAFLGAVLVSFRDVFGAGEDGLAGTTLASIERLWQVRRDGRHPLSQGPVHTQTINDQYKRNRQDIQLGVTIQQYPYLSVVLDCRLLMLLLLLLLLLFNNLFSRYSIFELQISFSKNSLSVLFSVLLIWNTRQRPFVGQVIFTSKNVYWIFL